MSLAGCQTNENDPSLLVDPQRGAIEFSASAMESYTFTVETNQPSWEVESDQTWCQVTKSEDGKSFVAAALPNDTATASAPAVITVTAGSATPVTIGATQTGGTTYGVTVATDGNGTVDPSQLTGLAAGSRVTLTATPADGYALKQWTVYTGNLPLSDPAVNPLVFMMPASNVSLKAEFVALAGLPSLTITTPWGADGGEMNFFFAGEGEVTIDWGDGSAIETVPLNPLSEQGLTTSLNTVPHTFVAGSAEKTITLRGTVTGVGTGLAGSATAIDASDMPSLAYLDCRLENISSLDLSGCAALRIIHGYDNDLSSIDLSDCAALEELYLSGNRLTSLDLSHNPALNVAACDRNNLDKAALLEIFHALPDRSGGSLPEGELFCGGYTDPNPGYAELTDADRKICADKNWWPYNGR